MRSLAGRRSQGPVSIALGQHAESDSEPAEPIDLDQVIEEAGGFRVGAAVTGAELKEHADSKYEVLDSEMIELTHSYRDGESEVFYTPDGVEYRCPRAAVEAGAVEKSNYVAWSKDGEVWYAEAAAPTGPWKGSDEPDRSQSGPAWPRMPPAPSMGRTLASMRRSSTRMPL